MVLLDSEGWSVQLHKGSSLLDVGSHLFGVPSAGATAEGIIMSVPFDCPALLARTGGGIELLARVARVSYKVPRKSHGNAPIRRNLTT